MHAKKENQLILPTSQLSVFNMETGKYWSKKDVSIRFLITRRTVSGSRLVT